MSEVMSDKAKLLKEKLEELEVEDVLLAEGLEEAFIGLGERCGQPPIAVYDIDKVIKLLMAEGHDYEEAVEHLEFNVLESWFGDRTPIFIRKL
jgi:hypothetical protein